MLKTLTQPDIQKFARSLNDKWTGEDIQRLVCNPIYAGIGPYPAVIEDDVWISAAMKLMKEMGRERFFKLMLEELRSGFPKSAE